MNTQLSYQRQGWVQSDVVVIVEGFPELLEDHLLEGVDIPVDFNIDHHLLPVVYQQTLYN